MTITNISEYRAMPEPVEAVPWYVAAVLTQRTRAVILALTEQQIDHYVPHETIWNRGRRFKVAQTKPLLPGYVFCQTHRLDLVRAIHGVIRFVGFPDPRQLSQAAVERLEAIRQAEDDGLFDRTRRGAGFKVGQRVRVTKGPFMGFIADIARFKGQRRVIVAMKALGSWAPGPAEVDVSALEAAA